MFSVHINAMFLFTTSSSSAEKIGQIELFVSTYMYNILCLWIQPTILIENLHEIWDTFGRMLLATISSVTA